MSAAVASATVMGVGSAGVPSVGRADGRKRPRDEPQAASSDGADVSHSNTDDAARRVRARVTGPEEGDAASASGHRSAGSGRGRPARARRASAAAKQGRAATSQEHDRTRGTTQAKPQTAPTSERKATTGRGRRKGMPRRSGPGLTACLLHPDRGLQAGGVRNHLRPSLVVDEAPPPDGVGLGMCHACFMWSLRHYGLDRQPHLRCYRRHDGVQVVAAKCRVKLQSLRRVGIIMRDMDGPCRCPRCDSENTYAQHPGLAPQPVPTTTTPPAPRSYASGAKGGAPGNSNNNGPTSATEQSAAAALLEVGLMAAPPAGVNTAVIRVKAQPPHVTHTRAPHGAMPQAAMRAPGPPRTNVHESGHEAHASARHAGSDVDQPGVSSVRRVNVAGPDGHDMAHHGGMHPVTAGMQYSGPMMQGAPPIATMHVMHDYHQPPQGRVVQYDHHPMMMHHAPYGYAMYPPQGMYGHPGMHMVQGPPPHGAHYMHGPMPMVAYGPPHGMPEQHPHHHGHGQGGMYPQQQQPMHHLPVHKMQQQQPHHGGPMQPTSGGRGQA